MEDKTSNGLPFGKRLRCGNFYVEKVSRALGKKDAKAVRDEFLKGMPKGYKGAQRASMPVIRVGDIAGMWRIEYAFASAMFHVIDAFDHDGVSITDDTCYRLLTMLFCDTTVLGDEAYMKDRVKALNKFSLRIKAPDVDGRDEESLLEAMKAIDAIEHGDDFTEESK